MYQFDEKIKKFLQENFEPATTETADFKFTNIGLLEHLFTVFPKDCISDFELYDILLSIGYEIKSYTDDEDRNSLVWCLKKKENLTN